MLLLLCIYIIIVLCIMYIYYYCIMYYVYMYYIYYYVYILLLSKSVHSLEFPSCSTPIFQISKIPFSISIVPFAITSRQIPANASGRILRIYKWISIVRNIYLRPKPLFVIIQQHRFSETSMTNVTSMSHP